MPFFSELESTHKFLVAKDMEAFKAWDLLPEVDIIVVVIFAGGNPGLIVELWPLCSKVRWVHSMAAGVETVVPLMKSLPRGEDTPLTNAKGAFSRSLAEYSLMCMLHFNKQVPRLQANRAGGVWDKFVMSELHGMTAGFIGFGDIAQATARLCKVFGMNVIANRNSKGKGDELCDKVYYGLDDKLIVFRDADYVVCSLPGGEATKYYCNEPEFAAMKSTGVFISIGRGTCVCEAALAKALQEGRIAGAALDVFEVEPLPKESQLWQCERLLLSAHNADFTSNYMDLTFNVFLDKLSQYSAPDFTKFDGEVDKSKGY